MRGKISILFWIKKDKDNNEELYKTVVETVRNSLDINTTREKIINVIGKALKADRCFIIEYDKENDRFNPPTEEYLSNQRLKSYIGIDMNEHIPHFVKEFKQGKKLLFNQKELQIGDEKINLHDGTFEAEKNAIEEYNVYSGVVYPFFHANEFLGDIVVHYIEKVHNASEEEIKLLEITAGQLAVALYQATLFDKLKTQNEIQNTILNNIPFMAWLKDIKGNYIMVNKKMAELYGDTQENMIGKTDFDYTPELSKEYQELDKIVMKEKTTKIIEEFVINKGEKRWSETFKSPLIDAYGNVVGTVGLAHDITEKKRAELEILKRQEKILLYAQREKISRNIIEILRSSIDKTIIKKLFVKNIGKFFNADRVLLSEYDEEKKEYLPVDKDSEYISSPNVKSFIDYDWSQAEASGYIQPLLEKRELNIYSLDEYLEQNEKDQDFIYLFLNANVKSSYNFPILYQNNIMGFFCIEFTQQEVKLTEEDIQRLRNMCTQAGIALYHAKLYQQAQQLTFSKEIFLSEISDKIKKPTNEILEITTLLSENKFDRTVEIDYLNKIIISCNELIELTNNVEKNE